MRILHSFWILFLLSIAPLLAQQIPARKPIILPEYAAYLAPNSIYIVGQFIPLGFSPDGKFAYVVEPPDEACGCYFFELRIRDLRTDRDVWTHQLEYQGVATVEWDRAWKENGKAFWTQLQTYGIVLGNVEPATFPIAIDGKSLNLSIDREYQISPLSPDEKFISHAHVYLASSPMASKRLASFDYSSESILDLSAGVYFQSPFEDRAAIILLRQGRGWEGPPSTINYEVVGAYLKKGFVEQPPMNRQGPSSGNR